MDLVLLQQIMHEVKVMKVETITKLVDNYTYLEQTLIQELEIDDKSKMSSAEEIWHPVFKRIVPTKFNVSKNVYIIDAKGHESKKVSLAIYDEQYTPYIFNYGIIKYIPIEAVFAVVHCEDEENQTKTCEWLKKIQELQTEMNAYVRIQGSLVDNKIEKLYEDFKSAEESKRRYETQTATRPITILCTTCVVEEINHAFDIVLKVDLTKNILTKKIVKNTQSLSDWYEELNHFVEHHSDAEQIGKIKMLYKKTERNLQQLIVKRDKEEQVLISLMFQLNQLLMLINNPMFFPHASYVKAFSDGGKTDE